MTDELQKKKDDAKNLDPFSRKVSTAVTIIANFGCYVYFALNSNPKKAAEQLFNMGNRYSLTEGSIFGSNLWVPNEYGFGRVDSGLNFSTLKYHKGKPFIDQNMRIVGYRLDEHWNMPEEERTPFYDFNPKNFDHFIHIEPSPLERLIEGKFVKHRTYSQAYNVLFPGNEEVQQKLSILGISEEKVFQVTPKGNSLILLFSQMGDKKPKEQTEGKLSLRTN